MIEGEYKIWDIGALPPKILFNKLESYLKKDFASMPEDDYGVERNILIQRLKI